MPGAFEASPEWDWDPVRTAEEIQSSGEATLEWLTHIAATGARIDLDLICAIHRHWFETTFPSEAGETRKSMVINRKSTAAPVESILPSVRHVCENWTWRLQNCWPDSEEDAVAFLISESNTLAVAVYDIHPFVDGNTRVTWHLRNYALISNGLRPLIEASQRYEDAWWASTPHSHEELDDAVLEILAREDRP